jgi:hypothetical protein
LIARSFETKAIIRHHPHTQTAGEKQKTESGKSKWKFGKQKAKINLVLSISAFQFPDF